MSFERQLTKCETKLADLLRQHNEAITACESGLQVIDEQSRQRQEDSHARYVEQQQEAEEDYDAKIAAIRRAHQQELADAGPRKTAAIAQLDKAHEAYLAGVDWLTSQKNGRSRTIAATFEERSNTAKVNYRSTLTALSTAQRQAEAKLEGGSVHPIPELNAQFKDVIAALKLPLANLIEKEATLRDQLTSLSTAEQADKRHLNEEDRKRKDHQAAIIARIENAYKATKEQLAEVRWRAARLTSAKPKGAKTTVNIGDVNDALQQLHTCKIEADRLREHAARLGSGWEMLKRRSRRRAIIAVLVLLGVLFAAYAVITRMR